MIKLSEKNKVEEAYKYLLGRGIEFPDVGIVLGTGLEDLVNEIHIEAVVEYQTIPHFPKATMTFQQSKFIFGKIGNVKVLAMQGRFHYYEGHTMGEIVFPIRVMSQLKIKQLIISNASGNMNLDWQKGNLMLIDDHINLQPDNPLRSKDAAEFGNIFVDMSMPYDSNLKNSILDISKELGISMHKGVYVAVLGPSLETKAEYKMLRSMGADAVGMSTVPEVIAANQLGIPTVAISVLTDDCDPDNLKPINIEEVLATAKKTEKSLTKIIKAFVERQKY